MRQAAGTGGGAATEIEKAKALLDSGAITQSEFDDAQGEGSGVRRKRRGRVANAVLTLQLAAWVGRGLYRMRRGNAPWSPVRHGLRRH